MFEDALEPFERLGAKKVLWSPVVFSQMAADCVAVSLSLVVLETGVRTNEAKALKKNRI